MVLDQNIVDELPEAESLTKMNLTLTSEYIQIIIIKNEKKKKNTYMT